MNQDLEKRLEAMLPAEIPQKLQENLSRCEPPARGKIRWLRFLAPLAAAAAIAVLATPALKVKRAEKPPATATGRAAQPSRDGSGKTALPQPSDFRVFVPIEQTSTLLDVREVTIVDAEPSRPVRYVRTTWLDDITYAGDDGSSRIRRQASRAEIIPIPIDSF